MNRVTRLRSKPDPEVGPWIGMRTRLLALAAACVIGGLALAGALVLHWAGLEQRSTQERALAVARATVYAADREIAASIARLEALATSPALRTGDLKAFYDQLVAMPLPEGTWFVLYDTERQLLNTLRPFGHSPLPRISDFNAGSQAAMRRAFATRQLIVSPVVWGVLAQAHLVAVTIPVMNDNEVTHLFDLILSDRRISRVIDEQQLPPTWSGMLIDRYQSTIARARMSARPAGPGVPEAWTDLLRGPEAQGTFFGDRGDAPVLVTFARSSMSDWIAVIEVPWTGLSAPLLRTLHLLVMGGVALVGAAVLFTLVTARGAERPLQALRTVADQARAGQREAEARYRSYWRYTDEALFVLSVTADRRFVFEGLNPAYEQLTGLLSASAAGREPSECLQSQTAAVLVERCRRSVETGVAVRYEDTIDLPIGQREWEYSLAPVCDPASGAVLRVLGSARDVTDRRRSEEALRRLGGRLLTLQDDERRRIARDLHDSTAQVLLGASFAVARVRLVSSNLTEDADNAIDEALSLIEQGQKEIRTLAYLLHPPLLDEMGLPAALRWYAKGFARRSGLEIAVDVSPDLAGHRLQRDVESALFRVAQEALGNAHRHSGGTRVHVTLATSVDGSARDGRGAILLAVQDNGRGFAEAQAASADIDSNPALFGVGLVGMRERMRQLGGRLAIRLADPSGAVVEAWVSTDAIIVSKAASPLPQPSVAALD